jgi:YbbR domain-containing protein
MVGEIPSELTLNVNGRGYSLLREIFSARQHQLNLKVLSLNFNTVPSDSNKAFVLTKTMKEFLQRQMGTEITLNYIIPDTLFYNFSTIIRKKAPVEPNINIEFNKQYMLGSSLIVQPDSIIVSGPKVLIDTISKVQTEFKNFNKTDKSFSTELMLIPISGVYFVRKKVTLTVPVEKFTESFVMVPVRVLNIPDSMTMKTFPSAIKVNFIVSLRNYNKINAHQFRVIVDYKGINLSINNKLKVTLERQPVFVKSVSYHPKDVDYIIEK